MRATRYRPPKIIAVDVDGTLVIKGRGNTKLIQWLKAQHAAGYVLILWSMRGERYAEMVANELGIRDLFTHVLGKPGYVVDDKGWGWIRDTKVVTSIK